MPEYRTETSSLNHQEKVQNASNHRKSYAYSFLGHTSTAIGTLLKQGFNSEQCLLQ